ncbi:hypothetical protein EVAR_27020_1 [Eumeta japonica]|uniref:Uncharacterized protein n=1 Tax=Eumeta variegata TaxID=151549 RepID=A0A4C1WD62_EUMVA|nr:hypothetical protein EVAR_27020_1 [Eumeta japonica]
MQQAYKHMARAAVGHYHEVVFPDAMTAMIYETNTSEWRDAKSCCITLYHSGSMDSNDVGVLTPERGCARARGWGRDVTPRASLPPRHRGGWVGRGGGAPAITGAPLRLT